MCQEVSKGSHVILIDSKRHITLDSYVDDEGNTGGNLRNLKIHYPGWVCDAGNSSS